MAGEGWKEAQPLWIEKLNTCNVEGAGHVQSDCTVI